MNGQMRNKKEYIKPRNILIIYKKISYLQHSLVSKKDYFELTFDPLMK